jgi:hypothetical protein
MAEEASQKGPVDVSRDELYRQVWQTPMSRLAVQYGITGNGLAKICDRLNVPYPPRGYWAKKAAGKRVATYRLPPAQDDTPQRVTIRPTPPPASPPEPSAEVRAKVETARAEAASITVPARLLRPHPIIAHWLAEPRHPDPWTRKPATSGAVDATERRRYRILDALLKAMEKRGGKAKEGDRRDLYIDMQGEKIELQLREKHKQVRRPLNDSEKRWASAHDKGWRQELQPTGNLVLTIRTHLPGNLRTEWLESDAKPIESALPEIVATFVAAAPLLAEQRRRREEAERQRLIAEQRRYEEEQRQKLDNNRWRRFVELARQRRDAEAAHAFLAAVKAANINPEQEVAGNSIADWIAWAERRLAHADPLNQGVGAVFEAIAKVTTWTYRD